MPVLYTREPPRKRHPRREDAPPEMEDAPRPRSGFFRGVLFALPAAALLWTLIVLAAKALLHHL